MKLSQRQLRRMIQEELQLEIGGAVGSAVKGLTSMWAKPVVKNVVTTAGVGSAGYGVGKSTAETGAAETDEDTTDAVLKGTLAGASVIPGIPGWAAAAAGLGYDTAQTAAKEAGSAAAEKSTGTTGVTKKADVDKYLHPMKSKGDTGKFTSVAKAKEDTGFKLSDLKFWDFGEFHEDDCPGESGVCLPPEGDPPPPRSEPPPPPRDDQSGYEPEYDPYYQTALPESRRITGTQLRRMIQEELRNEVRHPAAMAPGLAGDHFVWDFGEFHEADEVEELEELDLGKYWNRAKGLAGDVVDTVGSSVRSGVETARDVADKVAQGRGTAALSRLESGIGDATTTALRGAGEAVGRVGGGNCRMVCDESRLRAIIRRVLINEYYSR